MLEVLPAIVGGVLIGLAACLLMLCYGRIAGISSMLQHLVTRRTDEWFKSMMFLLGLVLGALLLVLIDGEKVLPPKTNPILIIISGLLVGYGTSLGKGCTSGHGVCGIGRLSVRSIVATLCFMGSGIATVYVMRHLV